MNRERALRLVQDAASSVEREQANVKMWTSLVEEAANMLEEQKRNLSKAISARDLAVDRLEIVARAVASVESEGPEA